MYTSLSTLEPSRTIGRQMLRSGTSVGAHYREASRARSDAEFVSKLSVLLQELDETLYWIELIEDSEIDSPVALRDLKAEANELMAIFTTIVKRRKSKD